MNTKQTANKLESIISKKGVIADRNDLLPRLMMHLGISVGKHSTSAKDVIIAGLDKLKDQKKVEIVMNGKVYKEVRWIY